MKKIIEFEQKTSPEEIGQVIFDWLKDQEEIQFLDEEKYLSHDVKLLIEIVELKRL